MKQNVRLVRGVLPLALVCLPCLLLPLFLSLGLSSILIFMSKWWPSGLLAVASVVLIGYSIRRRQSRCENCEVKPKRKGQYYVPEL